MEPWAPFSSSRCLLHESTITAEMRIDLVNSRTGTAIEFSGNRSFELTFFNRICSFFLPQAIEKSIVKSQIGSSFLRRM